MLQGEGGAEGRRELEELEELEGAHLMLKALPRLWLGVMMIDL